MEAVIESFHDVAQCVVVGTAHPERGEEVCAVLVPARGKVDVESVARRARDALSSYKVPTRWLTATDDQLPILPSGKLNRPALGSWFVSSAAAEAL